MDVGCKVAHGGADAGVQRAAVRQVAAETHARGADAAIARGQGEERVDAQGGVFVVGRDGLVDFPLVAGVGARAVVGEWLWAGEFVVRAGRGDDVALRGDLAGEAGDGAGDCGWEI